jgi:hypothetical protein
VSHHCPCFFFGSVSSLAYPNLLGTKRLGCCCKLSHHKTRLKFGTEGVNLVYLVKYDICLLLYTSLLVGDCTSLKAPLTWFHVSLDSL